MSIPQWNRLTDEANRVAVYVNVPYCDAACSFCHYIPNLSFRHTAVPGMYVEALAEQAVAVLGRCRPARPAVSCYFGGGTPSLLSTAQLAFLFRALDQVVAEFEEVCIEIHPATWNEGYLDLRRFTRFSIGVQSFRAERLGAWGRLPYDAAAVSRIVADIHAHAPTAAINIDLLLDGPLDEADLALAAGLRPDSITLYPKTGRKHPGEVAAIRRRLDRASALLPDYTPLNGGCFIFCLAPGTTSRYACHEYEDVGDIVGLGHNSVSLLGPDAYLCVYEGQAYSYRPKHLGDRYLRTMLRGVAIGVTQQFVRATDPDVLAFLAPHDRCDRLWYLPGHRYGEFYEHIQRRHRPEHAREFLRAVLYGDDRPDLLPEAADVPAFPPGRGH
jgi:hypothetical protein